VDNLLIYDRILGDEGGISGLLRAYPYVTDRQIQVAFDSYRTHTAEIDHIIKVQNEQLMAVGEAPYDTAK